MASTKPKQFKVEIPAPGTEPGPGGRKKEIEPYKIFNSSAKALMRQIDIIFPHETNLVFIQKEIAQYSAKGCKAPHVPAMKFYKSMGVPTGILTPDGAMCVLGDMILNHDERMFADECSVKIPELEAIDLKAKWRVLSDENREVIWQYLEKMAKLSAKVASLKSLESGQLDDIASKVRAVCEKLPPGLSEEEKIRAVLADPQMVGAAVDIRKKLGDMGLIPRDAPKMKI